MRVSGIISEQVKLLLGLGASEVRLLNTAWQLSSRAHSP